MALTCKRKIIIAVSAAALVGIIIVVSIRRRQDEPEVTTVVVHGAPRAALDRHGLGRGATHPVHNLRARSRAHRGDLRQGRPARGPRHAARPPEPDAVAVRTMRAGRRAPGRTLLHSERAHAGHRGQNGVATAQQSRPAREASLAHARQQFVSSRRPWTARRLTSTRRSAS